MIHTQYTIAGLNAKTNKWYREGKFQTPEAAYHFFKHHRKDFKNYKKLKLQVRLIYDWEDSEELSWLEEG